MSLDVSSSFSQSLHSLMSEESCLCVQNKREAPSFWSCVGVPLVEPLVIDVFLWKFQLLLKVGGDSGVSSYMRRPGKSSPKQVSAEDHVA